jgi:hypothetical protein
LTLPKHFCKKREIFIAKTPSLDDMIPSSTNKDGLVNTWKMPAREQYYVSSEVFAVA